MVQSKVGSVRRRPGRLVLVAAGLVAAMTFSAGMAVGTPRERDGGSTEKVLTQRPFPPKDVALFTPQTYPASGPLVAPTEPAVSEKQLVRELTWTLNQRCPKRTKEGVRLFTSDPKLRRTIPDATLRAAAAALLCTFGEPAISVLRTTLYAKAAFGQPPGGSGTIAQVVLGPDGRLVIVCNERFRFEDFRLWAQVLFHESLHEDATAPNREELVNISLEELVNAQMYLTLPSLATSGTELARRFNTRLMARINSGPGSRLGLFTANGPIVYPGGTPLPYFAYAFVEAGLGPATPGNAVLRGTLALIANKGTRPPRNADFDDATLQFIDRNQGLSPNEVLRVAKILRLSIPKVDQRFGRGNVMGAAMR